MSKFRLCRWIYQNGQMKTPNSLAEMQVEDRIVKAHNKLSESVKQCRKTYFIWDSNIFLSFVKEIKYFASLNLITEDDVAHLKDELYQLLSVMETLSVKGGAKSLFLSLKHWFRSDLHLHRETRLPSQFAPGVFHQFDGFAKSANLSDTAELDSIIETTFHTNFRKWRSPAYRVPAKATYSDRYSLKYKQPGSLSTRAVLPSGYYYLSCPTNNSSPLFLDHSIDSLPECDAPIHWQQSVQQAMIQTRKRLYDSCSVDPDILVCSDFYPPHWS